MQGVVNALYLGIKRGIISTGDVILIQVDCQQAIDNFLKFRTKMTDEETSLIRLFYKLEKGNDIMCHFRHVPGHTNGKEPRLAANNQCDRDARLHMRKMRTRILLEEGESNGDIK